MLIILKNAKKYLSSRTRALGTRSRTRLKHQVLVFDNFKNCVLVLEARVLDSSIAFKNGSSNSAKHCVDCFASQQRRIEG